MNFLQTINYKLQTKQGGFVALSITIIALAVTVSIVISLAFIFLNRFEAARNLALSEQAYFTAESGIEDALLRFFDSNKALPSSTPYTLLLGSSSSLIDITSGTSTTTISSIGNSRDRVRSLEVIIGTDPAGTTFSFSAHIGERGLTMDSNARVNGNVYSNGDIEGGSNTIIDGNADAVGIISSPRPTVTGTKTQGADPVPLPPFDEQGWKDAANINNDPHTGNLTLNSGTTYLGPKKIEGNLKLNSNAKLIVTGPLHITGNFIMNSNTSAYLDNSFGSNGTTIFAEGIMEFNSNAEIFATNANPKGYIMFASTSTSSEAIELESNASQEAVLYAVNGNIELDSNGDITAIIGNGIDLDSNAEINFDSGLITYTFSSRGSGSYDIINWREQ